MTLIATLVAGFLLGAGVGLRLTIFALLPATLLLALASFAVAIFYHQSLIDSAISALATALLCQTGYVISSYLRSRFAARRQRRPRV